MVRETIDRIEETIHVTDALNDKQKSELLQLITELKTEINELSEEHDEAAGSIASYTESSIREAVKTRQNPELFQHTLDGLRLSVRRLEVTHPTLTGIINNIGQILNNMGI